MRRHFPRLSLIAWAAFAAVSPVLAEIKVTPEAQSLMSRVSAAYAGLKSLQLAGTLSADLDIAGQPQKQSQSFTASYQAPNRFRHEMKDEIVVGSTGDKFYAFAAAPNVYLTADAPAEKPATSDLPDAVRRTLEGQNPSLLLAIAKEPGAAIREDVAEISTDSPTTVDGIACDTLVLSMGSDKPTARLLVDTRTHLIRQVQTDLKPDLQKRGAADVKKAIVTVDYSTTTPDARLPDNAFAWTAPQGARETTLAQASDDAPGGSAKALVGKPAPDFSLTNLDGTKVSLKDLKGSVVILDFWATWCGPCVQALPKLQALYEDKKDDGLKAFAVNMQEEPDKVKAFVEKTKLSVPVLMETKGDVAERYKVEAIPQTVVIDKAGVVRRVFVGMGPESEAQLKAAVEELSSGH